MASSCGFLTRQPWYASFHSPSYVRTNISLRKHNLKPLLATSIPRPKKKIQSTARFTISRLERKTFSKDCGALRIGIANSVLPSAYWRMISRKHDGRLPHSRMPMPCLGSVDLVNLHNHPVHDRVTNTCLRICGLFLPSSRSPRRCC